MKRQSQTKKNKDEVNNKPATVKENSGDLIVTGHIQLTGNTCATKANQTGSNRKLTFKIKQEMGNLRKP